MKVTYTLDDNYIFPFIISAYSAYKNLSPDCVIEVIKVPSQSDAIGLSQEGESVCKDICDKLGLKLELKEVTVDSLDAKLRNFPAWDRFTQTTWLRYFALFSELYDPGGVLRYVEPDTIFMPKSHKFLNLRPSNSHILARRTGGHEKVTQLWMAEGQPNNGYFNCGVMIVDLDLWRKRHELENFQSCVHTAIEMNFKVIEQDALNLMIRGAQENLPDYLNAFPEEFNPTSTGIIHFAGGSKPWLYSNKMLRRKLDNNSLAAMKVWESLEAKVFRELKSNYPETHKQLKRMRKTLRPRSSKVFFDYFPNMISCNLVAYILRKRRSSRAARSLWG